MGKCKGPLITKNLSKESTKLGVPGWLGRALTLELGGCEFKSHVGCRDHLKVKSLRKKKVQSYKS